MTSKAIQGIIGCAILALGFAIGGKFAILAVLVLDVGAGMRAAGSVILADYALELILVAWRTKAR